MEYEEFYKKVVEVANKANRKTQEEKWFLIFDKNNNFKLVSEDEIES